ncbi:hypothetical protein ANCCAN_04593 [Ancylostoma caninum]|uniref:Uncharacterized protein n=1 Tax=Ancylostoma caninum TaxID=29170 RepID=A0A368GY99_ANCCA|nr:hypothetical protein ANCCAN_04593 [Ancylostoma caninum]
MASHSAHRLQVGYDPSRPGPRQSNVASKDQQSGPRNEIGKTLRERKYAHSDPFKLPSYSLAFPAAVSIHTGASNVKEGMCYGDANSTKSLSETRANSTTSTTFISKDKLCTTTTTTFTSKVKRNASSSVVTEEEENTSSKYVLMLITEEITNTTCVTKPNEDSTPTPSTKSSDPPITPLLSTTHVREEPTTSDPSFTSTRGFTTVETSSAGTASDSISSTTHVRKHNDD